MLCIFQEFFSTIFEIQEFPLKFRDCRFLWLRDTCIQGYSILPYM